MSKTIRLSDVQANPADAVRAAQDQARAKARFLVINAKRSLHGQAAAYVDGHLVDGGVDARSDVHVKA